jgi:hypothetical protein
MPNIRRIATANSSRFVEMTYPTYDCPEEMVRGAKVLANASNPITGKTDI